MTRPANLPADAIGYLALSDAKSGRWRLHRPDGSVSNSFGRDDTREAVAGYLAAGGMELQPDNAVTWAHRG